MSWPKKKPVPGASVGYKTTTGLQIAGGQYESFPRVGVAQVPEGAAVVTVPVGRIPVPIAIGGFHVSQHG